MEQSLNQNVDTLFTNMTNFTQNEGLIGKPVTHGDKTFLPVISVTLGYGGGDSHSKAHQNSNVSGSAGMFGGAVGLGAKLCTDAVIVIDKDDIKFASISNPGSISQMIDKVPQIIGNMTSGGQQMSGQQTNGQQTSGQQTSGQQTNGQQTGSQQAGSQQSTQNNQSTQQGNHHHQNSGNWM